MSSITEIFPRRAPISKPLCASIRRIQPF
jgi:hypothetical protein